MSRNNDEEFLIAFLSSRTPLVDGDNVLMPGLIRIASFEEVFQASISFWSEQDYETHWRQQLELVAGGAARGLLITSMYDPGKANFIFSWPLWRRDDIVIVQNRILFLEELPYPFDPRAPELLQVQRETHTEDGAPISEWYVPVKAIDHFLAQE